MNQLDRLENISIRIIREAYSSFKSLCMLWSIGKDSTVLLHLARRAFFGHVPFPLVHIDTHYKIPEMIEYRNRLITDWKLNLIVGENSKVLKSGQTYPEGKTTRLQCCKSLKTEVLINTLNGTWPRYVLNIKNGMLELDKSNESFTGVIAGVRADEEGSRSKERYFSPRGQESNWNIGSQPPEFWNYYKTEFKPGTHVRIHPLLDWTELDIWKYIEREKIPVVPLYFNNGNGKRYRSLGCWPCTHYIDSQASTISQVIAELESGQLSNIAERSGRAQDKEDGGGLEELRKNGYM